MKIAALLALPALAIAWPVAAQTGAETRVQAEARAVAIFAKLDLDGDGVVTRDEMGQFAASHTGQTFVAGGPLPPQAAAMFDDADTDHDGRITRAEAIAGALRGFDEADTNHDGKVTPEEAAAAARRVAADIGPTPGTSPAPPREVAGPPPPQD